MKNKKVLVALSGGVDSAVVAHLLKEGGFYVVCIFMNIGQVNAKEDLFAARNVAKKIGVPFKVINLKKEFKKDVINYFIDDYSRGNTPNPCVVCNKKIKIGLLYKKMKEMKFDYLATGHYIKKTMTKDDNNIKLKLYTGKDSKKDQSYFLYNLKQRQLKHLIFPLGGHSKDDIKAIAKELRLPTLNKESQDICFIGGMDHNIFLKKNIELKKGPIITTDGKVVGEHEGLPLYTIGQRRHIKIGGIGPFYAVKMNHKTNTLIVTNKFNDNILYSNKMSIKMVNWISGKKPQLPFKCRAGIRYKHPTESCIITMEKSKYIVTFAKKQRAFTPGQSVVFYKRNELLGGGIISKTIDNH